MARSIAELEKLTVAELRKEASEMMRNNPSLEFLIHGIPQTAGHVRRLGKKAELVHHLSLWEGQSITAVVERELVQQEEEEMIAPVAPEATEESIKLPVNLSEKTVERVKGQEEDGYSNSEEEKLAIARKLYYSTEKENELTGLREYQLSLCRSGKYFLPEFAILVARTRIIIESYADSKSPEGKAHPGSVQKIRVDVMRYLGQIVEQENEKFPTVNDRTLSDTYEDFDNAVRGAFKDIGATKYKLTQAINSRAEEDVRAILAKPFVEWAIDTVSHLPEFSARWKEVAIAIMLLTGRRQSEVLATGLFTYVDESTVIFEGQLKRHIAELVPSEEIPVLGKCAKQIVGAIDWLDKQGKRTVPTQRTVEALQLAAKKSHNRCSRYIAETMERLADKCKIVNGKAWEVNENGKVINKFKGHLCRQIYAQICAGLFNDPNERKKRAFISRILLENREAALSYDRDVEVRDVDSIRELCHEPTD